MKERTISDKQRAERRKGKPKAPLFGELLIESSWRPADRPPCESEGWLRAHGYAPDRRKI